MTEPLVYDDAFIRRILEEVKRIAMVGASANEMRPSYFAMLYLLNKGYAIDPVNPHYAGQTIQGRMVYPDLSSLPERPDMVQIFRRSEEVPPLVEAAIGLEDFDDAMRALAQLRAPVDLFFDKVLVNDPDAAIRANRLRLLNLIREATRAVADFSKIEG